MLRTLIKLKISKAEKRKLLRLQRSNIVLEPDIDGFGDIDSEDDVKNFNSDYKLFKQEFDSIINDEDNENGNHWYNPSDQ